MCPVSSQGARSAPLRLDAMKRSRLDACLGPRNIVSLNVGGQRFQTSRETLGRSAFFASLLQFDGGGDQDGDGNIFVDRSSRLFEVLLECWRTALRPPQKTISLWKKQLLEECKYFAADDAAARIAGRTCEETDFLRLIERLSFPWGVWVGPRDKAIKIE